MSGPIVRKYGFPNFEAIFGKRELKHGADEPAPAPADRPATDKPQTSDAPPDEATGRVEPKTE